MQVRRADRWRQARASSPGCSPTWPCSVSGPEARPGTPCWPGRSRSSGAPTSSCPPFRSSPWATGRGAPSPGRLAGLRLAGAAGLCAAAYVPGRARPREHEPPRHGLACGGRRRIGARPGRRRPGERAHPFDDRAVAAAPRSDCRQPHYPRRPPSPPTSKSWRGDARLAREVGIEAFLTKPVRVSPLHEALAAALGTRTSRKVHRPESRERSAGATGGPKGASWHRRADPGHGRAPQLSAGGAAGLRATPASMATSRTSQPQNPRTREHHPMRLGVARRV